MKSSNNRLGERILFTISNLIELYEAWGKREKLKSGEESCHKWKM